MIEASPGLAVEKRARDVAAILGLPDFVYTVPLITKGKGAQREVGDGLLIANGRGAVVQVKSRSPESTAENPERWIDKNARKAFRQAEGSLRTIRSQQAKSAPLKAVPVRVADFEPHEQEQCVRILDQDVSTWPTIVILDHPKAFKVRPPNLPAFWITLDDWQSLHHAIRSTTGIIDYVERTLRSMSPTYPLGLEMKRYSQIAEHMEQTVSGARGARPVFSTELLKDPTGAQHYRSIVEALWPAGERLPRAPLDEYRQIVDYLDAVVPGSQAELGNHIEGTRRRMEEFDDFASGCMLFERNMFVFACDRSGRNESVQAFGAKIASLAALRAEDLSLRGRKEKHVLAIGELHHDDHVQYCYVFQDPAVPLEPHVRRNHEWVFGRLSNTDDGTTPWEPRRNEPCPCHSGRKYKQCCLPERQAKTRRGQ